MLDITKKDFAKAFYRCGQKVSQGQCVTMDQELLRPLHSLFKEIDLLNFHMAELEELYGERDMFPDDVELMDEYDWLVSDKVEYQKKLIKLFENIDELLLDNYDLDEAARYVGRFSGMDKRKILYVDHIEIFDEALMDN